MPTLIYRRGSLSLNNCFERSSNQKGMKHRQYRNQEPHHHYRAQMHPGARVGAPRTRHANKHSGGHDEDEDKLWLRSVVLIMIVVVGGEEGDHGARSHCNFLPGRKWVMLSG